MDQIASLKSIQPHAMLQKGKKGFPDSRYCLCIFSIFPVNLWQTRNVSYQQFLIKVLRSLDAAFPNEIQQHLIDPSECQQAGQKRNGTCSPRWMSNQHKSGHSVWICSSETKCKQTSHRIGYNGNGLNSQTIQKIAHKGCGVLKEVNLRTLIIKKVRQTTTGSVDQQQAIAIG